jgi:dihydropyrimidine dehydrogenase (NAD+) subunit PreA
VSGLSTNGGYCGAAVRPIALHMVGALAREQRVPAPDQRHRGVTNWRDAVEFLLLGASNVQVCTEVMLRGYRIVEDMIEGLSRYMDERGFETLDQLDREGRAELLGVGRAGPELRDRRADQPVRVHRVLQVRRGLP